jgi:hypothetical protein
VFRSGFFAGQVSLEPQTQAVHDTEHRAQLSCIQTLASTHWRDHTQALCYRAINDQCAYQIIVWPDPKELPEVAEGNGCIGLEPEVLEVVGGGEVAAFTAEEDAGGCL